MSESKKSETEADKIWNEIKTLPIEAFGLTNQQVQQHVKPIEIPGNVLYVKLSATAMLPWLENTLEHHAKLPGGRSYLVELHDGYVSVKRSERNEEAIKKALKSV